MTLIEAKRRAMARVATLGRGDMTTAELADASRDLLFPLLARARGTHLAAVLRLLAHELDELDSWDPLKEEQP